MYGKELFDASEINRMLAQLCCGADHCQGFNGPDSDGICEKWTYITELGEYREQASELLSKVQAQSRKCR